MNAREGICALCSKCGRVIVKNIPSIGDICYACNYKRLLELKEEEKGEEDQPRTRVTKYKPVYKKKATGEREVFEVIWNERKHVSFVSGQPLRNEAKAWFFAHVLPKSTYPRFRLLPKNIVLLTFDEHYEWDNGDRDKLRKDPKWNAMFALEAELKELYINQKEF